NTSKILDFGISKVIHEPVKYSLIGGPMCGTLYYMSPEQLTDSERVNCKSDMYSLGATMYHMFTGKIPFETNNISELMTMHISKIPETPKTLNNNIIEDLSLLIMRLLEKSPSKRFENYEEIIFSLLNILKKYEKIESFSKENKIIVKELEKANKTISEENKEDSDGLQKMFFDKLSKGTVFEKEEPPKKEKTKLKKEFTDSISLTSKFLKNYVNIADSEEEKTQEEEEKVLLDIHETNSEDKEKAQKNISNEKINFDNNLTKKSDETNKSKEKFRKEMTDSVNLTSKFLKNFVTPVDFKDENIKVLDKENIINKSDEKIEKEIIEKEINEKKLINENAKIPEHFKDKIKLTDKDRNNNINEKNADLSKFDSDLAEKILKNISNSY
ncbi:MAG: protein kinase, partial [Cyanobacteriota bacterium]